MLHPSRFDDAVRQRLPLPLAHLYRRAHNAKTPLQQDLTAFSLWESYHWLVECSLLPTASRSRLSASTK
jgi:hypothetical protein